MSVKIVNPVTVVQGGSPTPPTPVAPDPYQVYAEKRPADWWPMPANADISDNELYFLYHLLPSNNSKDPGEMANMYIQGTNGSTLTIEYGAMVGGVFVADQTKTETFTMTNRALIYVQRLRYSDFPSTDDLPDGHRQVMMKMSSTGAITSVSATPYAMNTLSGNSVPGLVEFRGKASTITRLTFSDTGSSNYAARDLEYFSLIGENNLTDTALNRMFVQSSGLKAVLELDTSKAGYMASTFSACRSLVAIPQFDTSNITNMAECFFGCESLTTIPLLDTSGVTNFAQTFRGCVRLEWLPLLDTSSCTNFNRMFSSCSSLTTIPQFDTSNGIDFGYMFDSCSALETIPLLNTSNGTNMVSMFNSCLSLKIVPLLNTQNVTSTQQMFSTCNNLRVVPQFNLASVTDASSMFSQCYSLEIVPSFNLSSATNIQQMFNYCYNLQSVGTITLSDSNTVNCSSLFQGCNSLWSNPLITGGKISNAQYLFGNCRAMRFLDLSNLDLTNVTGTYYTNVLTSSSYDVVVKLDPTKNIPVAGLGSTFMQLGQASGFTSYVVIEDDTTMLPLTANATSVFPSYSYTQFVVPDAIYQAYAADTYWATLGTRLKKRSEVTLPSWYGA